LFSTDDTSSSERVGTPQETAVRWRLTGIVTNRESTNRLKTLHAARLEKI